MFKTRLSKFLRSLQALFVAGSVVTAVSSCTGNRGGSQSAVSLTFPSADVRSAAVTSNSSYDFSRSCFAVNIKGADIPTSKTSSCSIPIGVFGGFAAPGGTVSVLIPRGTARSLEVFVYQRPDKSAACPIQPDFRHLGANQIVRVGQIPSFDAVNDTVELNVQLSNPSGGESLMTQYSLASSCQVTPPTPTSAGFTQAHGELTGNGYKMSASIADHSNDVSLTGGSYKIKLMRKANN